MEANDIVQEGVANLKSLVIPLLSYLIQDFEFIYCKYQWTRHQTNKRLELKLKKSSVLINPFKSFKDLSNLQFPLSFAFLK